MQLTLESLPTKFLLQFADIAADLGANEGQHCRRGEALELTELRSDPGRGRHEDIREFFAHNICCTAFVFRVDVGEQKANQHCFDTLRAHFTRSFAHALLVQRNKLAAMSVQPSGYSMSVTAPDQGPVLPWQVLHDGIMLGTLMSPDMQNVAETLIRYHPSHRTVMLQHSICTYGRAVEQTVDIRDRNPSFGANRLKASYHPKRRVCRS